MTLHWIEEGFMVTQEEFDRLTRIVRPGKHIRFLSTPEHEGAFYSRFLKGERMPDNWKHRSQGMRCKTCMWFVPKEKSGVTPMTATEIIGCLTGRPMAFDLGRCRRHAPTMNGWPVVFVNDWCGDHKLDEEKL
jgi:hypothetical protein